MVLQSVKTGVGGGAGWLRLPHDLDLRFLGPVRGMLVKVCCAVEFST